MIESMPKEDAALLVEGKELFLTECAKGCEKDLSLEVRKCTIKAKTFADLGACEKDPHYSPGKAAVATPAHDDAGASCESMCKNILKLLPTDSSMSEEERKSLTENRDIFMGVCTSECTKKGLSGKVRTCIAGAKTAKEVDACEQLETAPAKPEVKVEKAPPKTVGDPSCEAICDHALPIMMESLTPEHRKSLESDVGATRDLLKSCNEGCRDELSVESRRCVMLAKTTDELDNCEKNPHSLDARKEATPSPPTGTGCNEVCSHVFKVMLEDPSVADQKENMLTIEEQFQKECVKECKAEDMAPAVRKCILNSKSIETLGECEK
jgi:hypothetical protein